MMQDSEKVLTQAEIDALLSGGSPAPAAAPEETAVTTLELETPTPPRTPEAPARASAPEPLGGEVPDLMKRIEKLEEAVGQTARQATTLAGLEDTVQKLQQGLQELAGHLQTVSVGLQGTVGFAARENFLCNSCSSKGFVAAKLTCTSCGVDNWWGWYPQ